MPAHQAEQHVVAIEAGVALMVNAGPHTASAADTSGGLAIWILLFGIAIWCSLRWHQDRRKREAA